MTKKRTKKPTESRLTLKKTEAPMMLVRDANPVMEMAPPVIVEMPAEVVEMAPVAEVPALSMIDHRTIAYRAFGKFVSRGYQHGHAVEDWLAAEAELRSELN